MPEHCSCGTELVPGARFCHRCGKAQGTEQLIAEVQAASAPPPPPREAAAAPPVPIGFHDPLAVRVALITASLTGVFYLLFALIFPALILWTAAGGYWAAVLYRRHSGRDLSAGGGARLGWINAVLAFVIATVLFSVYVLVVGINDLRSSLLSNMSQDARSQQILSMYNNPAVFGFVIVIAWLLLGIIASLGSVAGGAIGAKMAKRT